MSSIVLVHGAWSDASAWSTVASLLREAGHIVEAPNLPSHGHDTTEPADVTLAGYAATVADAAARLPGPVVLVGHSMAGTIISSVAEEHPEQVAQLIYVAAFLLPSGQSLYGFTQSSPGMADSALGPALRPGDGVLGVDPDQFVDVFCADAPSHRALAAQAALRPDPLAPLGTPIAVTPERWGSVPRAYVHTTEDRCISPASQREMVDAVGVDATASIDTSHLPMLAAPDELAALLVSLIAARA